MSNADFAKLGELRLLRADGREFGALMRAPPVGAGDRSAGTIWSVNDMQDLVQARDQLHHAACHEALTGAVNRQGLEQELLRRSSRLDRALTVAEKLHAAIDALSLNWETHTLRVGASVGVVELHEDHASAAGWLAQADAACYEAKRAGRGTVRAARSGLRLLTGGAG